MYEAHCCHSLNHAWFTICGKYNWKYIRTYAFIRANLVSHHHSRGIYMLCSFQHCDFELAAFFSLLLISLWRVCLRPHHGSFWLETFSLRPFLFMCLCLRIYHFCLCLCAECAHADKELLRKLRICILQSNWFVALCIIPAHENMLRSSAKCICILIAASV